MRKQITNYFIPYVIMVLLLFTPCLIMMAQEQEQEGEEASQESKVQELWRHRWSRSLGSVAGSSSRGSNPLHGEAVPRRLLAEVVSTA